MRSDKSDELSKLLYLGEEKRKYEAKKGDGKRARAESDFEEKDERDGVDEFESGEEEGEELSDVEEELFGKSTRQGESAPDIFDRDEKDFSGKSTLIVARTTKNEAEISKHTQILGNNCGIFPKWRVFCDRFIRFYAKGDFSE
ncbi:hypothetical protein AX774_g1585 [Zancudomyces culisetae]|uniref:Uncharacterized protein n=1 Tax=Zancudomyces culisetae TaxID=1213189 RepID=A0A1R1PVI4_ZANCU|nr:hypothetical protein AX774_g1585 [Zancudomyces culisetae]|eukprot:OMH84892.1 hypothetical protein AX774_g1585 [Zancudomyces culisetae]